MKIYTKTGDKGISSLYDGTRKIKSDIRFECIGNVDELNSILGIIASKSSEKTKEQIFSVQNDLFAVGAMLATPDKSKLLKDINFSASNVKRLEQNIDSWDKLLTPLKNFILPGGSESASITQLARAVCRRAERSIVNLNESEEINPDLLKYINRLSDWLFTLARIINMETNSEEVFWNKK